MRSLHPEQRSREEHALDALLDGPGRAAPVGLQPVARLLAQLHELTELPPPSPSRELASVLESGFAPSAPSPEPSERVLRPSPSVWLRRSALAVGLSAGLTASLVGAAAASNRLPERALEVWDRVVEQITPFDVGEPRPERPAPNEGGAGESTTDEQAGHGSSGTSPDEAPPETDGAEGVGGPAETEAVDTEDTEDTDRDRFGSGSSPSTEDEADGSRSFESDEQPDSSSTSDDSDVPSPTDDASSDDEADAVPANVEPDDSQPDTDPSGGTEPES